MPLVHKHFMVRRQVQGEVLAHTGATILGGEHDEPCRGIQSREP
jgi:hypothetical protein